MAHLSFGINLIKQAVELGFQYAQDCLPPGILGLTAPMFREYGSISQTAA